MLYEVDELNCPAIARLIGSTEDAVRKALQRARRRFAHEVSALTGGSFGSVLLWLRRNGLRRGLKAMPAASASTALVAFVGTVALTVSVNPAPERLLPNGTATRMAVSSRDLGVNLDLGPAGGNASRHVVRGTSASATAPTTNVRAPRQQPQGSVAVPVPAPLSDPEYYWVKTGVDTPVGYMPVIVKSTNDSDPGVVCSLDAVWCPYEADQP